MLLNNLWFNIYVCVFWGPFITNAIGSVLVWSDLDDDIDETVIIAEEQVGSALGQTLNLSGKIQSCRTIF